MTTGGGGVTASGAQVALAQDQETALARFPTFQHVVDLIRANREIKLLIEIETGVRLVAYQPGRIEFEPARDAAPDLAQRIGKRLQAWTGVRWAISIGKDGAPTIAETRDAKRASIAAAARSDPLVAAIFQAFPNSTLGALNTPEELAAEAATEVLAEVKDDWDPFEDE